MADLFSSLGRDSLVAARTRPADPETALPGLVPPSVTRAAADPEAHRWGEGDAAPAPGRLTPAGLVEGLNPQQAAAVIAVAVAVMLWRGGRGTRARR